MPGYKRGVGPRQDHRYCDSCFSTDDQDLSLQPDALEQHDVPKDLIFTDKLSGAKSERPGLDRCLDVLKPGGTLAVWRLDRLGRR